VSDIAEGWDHDRGGVFSGRAEGSCRDTMERMG
jgi:hypothetical protein